MITGDKLETAENIGVMSGILEGKDKMSIFELGGNFEENKGDFVTKVAELDFLIQGVRDKDTRKVGVVMDMRCVGKSALFFK